MGWAGLDNGELLARAEKEFDIFITVDHNLTFQQNLTQVCDRSFNPPYPNKQTSGFVTIGSQNPRRSH